MKPASLKLRTRTSPGTGGIKSVTIQGEYSVITFPNGSSTRGMPEKKIEKPDAQFFRVFTVFSEVLHRLFRGKPGTVKGKKIFGPRPSSPIPRSPPADEKLHILSKKEDTAAAGGPLFLWEAKEALSTSRAFRSTGIFPRA